jgi:hypothetical protein
MDFKALRKAAGLTLKQAAALSGYTTGAINGQELKGNGSDRLKAKLLEIYGQGSAPTPIHAEPAFPVKKIVIAKLRGQVQNIQKQIDAITETLNELES